MKKASSRQQTKRINTICRGKKKVHDDTEVKPTKIGYKEMF